MVDPSGQVRLIHETAREYLTRTTASPIAIRLPRSHYLLFEQTISALLPPDVRQKVIRAQQSLSVSEPFLLYAATSWMYHLQQSGEISDQTIDHLSRFFRTTSVLAWIHLLSVTDQLDRLVRAAKIVLDCVKAYRKSNMTKNPLLHKLSDLELLERWSADLLKIVGKFSWQLMIHPEAIYSQIPPLCPSSSVIYEQFYQQDFADIKILGTSQTDWNDNLARIPLPREEEGIKLCCFARYVAVLTSSGRVTIWDANHFKQVCSLVHQEAVTSMSSNRYGTQLLTFGLVTSKLWSVPSGELLATVVNPASTRSLSVTFRDTDKSVLAACTNRVIYSLDLEDLAAGWRVLSRNLLHERSEMGGAIVNSPRCVSFNGDASQVGVSYRGFPLSVWDLNEMRCIARCRRPTRRPSKPESGEVTWFAVDRFTWNSVTGHIIGLYKDGTVFKWHPATNEYQEASSSADEVAASPDGCLFVTSSSNGTVKVWSFEYLSVIYQLSSGDLVSELAFAPDSRRFYDIRGSLLNAWQSNSLLRFLEVDETFSDTSSQDQRSTSFSHISEAHTASYGAVSVIRARPEHGLYCAGNEEGIVTLFDEKSGELGKILEFPNFVSISCLAWSNDSGYVAGADLAGDIEVRKLTKVKTTGNGLTQVQSVPQSKPVLKKDGSAICDILFSHDSTLLLIISGLSAYIWSVEEGCVMTEKPIAQTSTQTWANHPTQPGTLLRFADNGITGYRWSDFSEIATALYDGLPPRSETNRPRLKGVRFSQNGKLAILHQTDITGVERLFIVDISALQLKPGSTSSIVRLTTIVPADVSRQVEVVLGILPGSRFFFLDRNLWLCSVFLNSSVTEDTIERHYFLPRDWTTTEHFQQCLLLENGTLLCPRENEVAVIKSELSRSY
ncbi:WD40 repeat domain-containing protein [Aspergillus foveolatus]|uniref:WD40 repeat domain-containing protein n=1 Tax=Aspergillus foveolatus TaxID=210207 RepID=UPI003CCCF65E